MSDRYFIGTGNRNLLDAANWSLTSGGSAYQPASGTEKITNAADRDFSSDTGFWTKTTQVAIGSGVCSIISSDGTSQSIYRAAIINSGKWYKFTYDVIANNSGEIQLTDGNSVFTLDSTVGSKTKYYLSTGAAIRIRNIGVTDIDIDNISFQEVDDIAPTSSINAIFDNNSGTGTITVNGNFNCADLTISNLAGALSISGSVYTFSVYGNLTLPATNLTISLSGTSYWYMKATTSVNITMGATTGRSFNRLYFDGVGGTWTMQDEMNIGTTQIYHLNGHWDTQNINVTTTQSYFIQTGIKTLTAGSSILRFMEWRNDTLTGFTFNQGTSTVILFRNANAGIEIRNAQTFYNLTLTGASFIISNCLFGGNVIVANELRIEGSNPTNFRYLVASNTIGTPRTITVNGSIVASNVDFRDIILAGTANRDLSAITGGSGDCGGNSGITFTPAVPQYYKHTSGACTWEDSTKWFSDQAKTIQGRVPLPQDDTTFDETSFTGTSTLTVDCPRIGRSLNMEAVANSVTMQVMNNIECYGSFVLGNNITTLVNWVVTYIPTILNSNISTFGKYIYRNSVVARTGYTVNFLSNISGQNLYLYSYGTINTNNFNITVDERFDTEAFGGALNLGNSVITSNRNNAGVCVSIGVSTSLNSQNSSIVVNGVTTSGILEFRGSGKTFNKIRFSGSHTGYFDISGNNTFAELIIDAGRKVRFTGGSTQTINKLTNNGAAGNLTTITSTTTTKANIVLPTVQNIDYANISYINVTVANKLFAGLNSVDGTNNVNVNFNAVAALIQDVEFAEAEVLESNPLSVAKVSTAFTENETVDINSILANAFTGVALAEIEAIEVNPSVLALISTNFTEQEQFEATMVAKALISVGFTEEEILTVDLSFLFFTEYFLGTSLFENIITGSSTFKTEITGRSTFISEIARNSKFI